MTDIVDVATRSRMMSKIRGKNTKPELLIRKALFARGFRYRLHSSKLSGKPDLVFTKYKSVIFINGCFWHGHDCHLFKWPKSNCDFWRQKIERNKIVDAQNNRSLKAIGWKVLVIWECSLKGKEKKNLNLLIDDISEWLHDSQR